jgi:hypothetical protein
VDYHGNWGKVLYSVQWLRQLAACLLPRRPDFAPKTIHVEFMVLRLVHGQVFLRVLQYKVLFEYTDVSEVRTASIIRAIHRPDDGILQREFAALHPTRF